MSACAGLARGRGVIVNVVTDTPNAWLKYAPERAASRQIVLSYVYPKHYMSVQLLRT